MGRKLLKCDAIYGIELVGGMSEGIGPTFTWILISVIQVKIEK